MDFIQYLNYKLKRIDERDVNFLEMYVRGEISMEKFETLMINDLQIIWVYNSKFFRNDIGPKLYEKMNKTDN